MEDEEFEAWEHLSDEGNELRRQALESDDLRLWDLAFLAGRISVAEGSPRYTMEGNTPGIIMSVIPYRLSQKKNQP